MEIISKNGNVNNLEIIGKNRENILDILDINKITIIMEPNAKIVAHLECIVHKMYTKTSDYNFYFNKQSIKNAGFTRKI